MATTPASAMGEWSQETLAQTPEPKASAQPATQKAASDPSAQEAPPLFFPSLDLFVTRYLAPVYRRSLDGRHRIWCPEWWRHAEAQIRLDALWRSWEYLRQEPATGMSVWLRDHADHHMALLLDPDGPFKSCGTDKGHSSRLQALPVIPAPPGLFDQ